MPSKVMSTPSDTMFDKKTRALSRGMTAKEKQFLELYKQKFKECSKENESLRFVAENMGIGLKSAQTYRYQRPRIRAEIDKWRKGIVGTAARYGNTTDVISIRWITQKLTALFERLEESGGKTYDMVSILNSLVNILSKFNNQFATDLDSVKNMPTGVLIRKFARISAKLFGNARAGTILAGILAKAEKGDDNDSVLERARQEILKPGNIIAPEEGDGVGTYHQDYDEESSAFEDSLGLEGDVEERTGPETDGV